MIQLRLVVALNTVGLALAIWGVTMLLGTHNPFLPIVEAIVTVIGLVVASIGTGWMTVLLLIGNTREQRTSATDSIPVRPATAASPVPRRDRLLKAMEELQDSALDLIERRRELHHMNLRQWHNEHRDETAGEIEATKRYRLAKTNLEMYRPSLPAEFWSPVDSFAQAIEESISREAYSTPNDKGVYEALNRNWHRALQGINDISFGVPASEPVGRASVN
ncbi:MAG: hypothetical protein O2909_04520 [Chloroflexi bacterium]|nr:hypothetical protein [Chloroflexota bacterium]MDA1218687.1 hypothetical protein [Chloroflexota bacterium]PKB57776.1 MAG: hypothetical protein BZY73_01410 [SAR202 cluster bacterium Casp-Chloro-G3]